MFRSGLSPYPKQSTDYEPLSGLRSPVTRERGGSGDT